MFSRFRVRLTVPNLHQFSGDKGSAKATCVRDTIQEFLNKGATVDPSFALVPWSAKDNDLGVRLPHPTNGPIPTHIYQAKKYYYSINYYSNQPDFYFYIRLRHEISSSSVLNNITRPMHMSLYRASLQSSEDPTKGGFFVYHTGHLRLRNHS